MRARIACAVGLSAAVLGLGAMPAYAHNSLRSSTPKDGAVLDVAPATVNLKFIATLPPQGTKVTIVDPAGAPAEGGAPRFDGPTVMVPLRPSIAGAYVVRYEVASADGHPVTGKITFTLTAAAVPPPPSPTPSPTPAAPPTTATTVAAPAVLPGEPAGNSTPMLPWLLVAGALLVTAGVGLTIRRRLAETGQRGA